MRILACVLLILVQGLVLMASLLLIISMFPGLLIYNYFEIHLVIQE